VHIGRAGGTCAQMVYTRPSTPSRDQHRRAYASAV
jgi:hypothetical protein